MAIQSDDGTGAYRNWIVAETEFNSEFLKKYETLFCLGNGYMGLRSATEEQYPGESRGWYIAGLFDQFKGEVTELANIPDWLATKIFINGEQFTLEKGKILTYLRFLNLKDGELVRDIAWETPQGHRFQMVFRRFVSLDNYHLAGLKIEILPLDGDAHIAICTGFDGQVTNSGAQHFVEGNKRVFQKKHQYYMTVKTQESAIDVALAAQHRFFVNDARVDAAEQFSGERRRILVTSTCSVKQQDTFVFEKIVSGFTGRDAELIHKSVKDVDVLNIALKTLEQEASQGYDVLFEQSKAVWRDKWKEMEIEIDGPGFDQLAIRFAQFHLIQMTPAYDNRLSIAAKGLSGEGYKGHVFWDTEIFMLPFFIYTFPEIARKLLEYRYNTLAGARQKARENGYRGAMYAWESALTGEETTPKWGAIDIVSGEPIRIWCGEIEQHITVDVVYGLWHYFQATQDHDFMLNYGYEILFDTANFWVSRLEYNQEKDQYEIHNVIGPDEYSEHVNNNAYTNYMVQWHLRKAAECAQWLKANHADTWTRLNACLHLEQYQQEWQDKAEKIYVAIEEETGIIPQYDGFMKKKVIDLSPYTGKVGVIFDNLGWEAIQQCQVIKQADVVMLLYLLGDLFSKEVKQTNWDFYEPKTLHDSSLSPAIHSILAHDLEIPELAYQYFERAARIDLGENMNRSDHGLHSASLGGVWQAVINGFAGMRIRKDRLSLTPRLPDPWKKLVFRLKWRGASIAVAIDKTQIIFKKKMDKNPMIPVEISGKHYEFIGEQLTVNYGRS